jgi:hypothetical protein
MALIVVAASTKSPDFAVIDFTKSPPTSVLVGASAAGNVVDCYGKLAAVGDWGSGTVTLFDISNPETPLVRGSVGTGLSRVTAISIDGAHVLAAGPNTKAGEAQLVLVSIANPLSPQAVSVYSHTGVTGSESISGVVIRGANALSCQSYGCLVMNYAHASHPSGVGYPSSSSTIGLDGQVLGDFDGTNAVITAPPSDWNGTQPVNVYLFSIANGIPTAPKPLYVGGNLLSSVAIAEIPEGGRYLATADLSSVTIQAFPESVPKASLSFFVPELGVPNAAVALKFLNNPAVAPLLAVANVTNEQGFLVTSNFLVLESDGQTSTLQRATPIPVAKVGLAPTLNPTLGITGWTG